MRRKDREIKDKKIIKSIIKKAAICRIALSENNMPYIIPINFGYKNNHIYLHSASEGKKIDIIRKNSNICFEMDIKHDLVKSESPCNYGMKYCSVIGFGKAYLVDDFNEKITALNTIMEHYMPGTSFEYPKHVVDELTIIRVDIESLTGKKSGY